MDEKDLADCLKKCYKIKPGDSGYEKLIGSFMESVSNGLENLSVILRKKIGLVLKEKDSVISMLEGKLDDYANICGSLDAYELLSAVSKGCERDGEILKITNLPKNICMQITYSLLKFELISNDGGLYKLTDSGAKLLSTYNLVGKTHAKKIRNLKRLDKVINKWEGVIKNFESRVNNKRNDYLSLYNKTSKVLNGLGYDVNWLNKNFRDIKGSIQQDRGNSHYMNRGSMQRILNDILGNLKKIRK